MLIGDALIPRDPRDVALVCVVYGAIVVAHYHAYVYATEEGAVFIHILHGMSIAGFMMSIALCLREDYGYVRLGGYTAVITDLCHNWLLHVWNTLLATTTYMSRLRISAVNDALCALALSFCAIRGIELSQQEFRSHGLPKGSRLRHSSLSRPSLLLSMAVTYTLVVHSFLLFGQAVQVPFLEEFVLLFYPEQVVREGGPFYDLYNLLRWLAVQLDLATNTFLVATIVRSLLAKPPAALLKRE